MAPPRSQQVDPQHALGQAVQGRRVGRPRDLRERGMNEGAFACFGKPLVDSAVDWGIIWWADLSCSPFDIADRQIHTIYWQPSYGCLGFFKSGCVRVSALRVTASRLMDAPFCVQSKRLVKQGRKSSMHGWPTSASKHERCRRGKMTSSYTARASIECILVDTPCSFDPRRDGRLNSSRPHI